MFQCVVWCSVTTEEKILDVKVTVGAEHVPLSEVQKLKEQIRQLSAALAQRRPIALHSIEQDSHKHTDSESPAVQVRVDAPLSSPQLSTSTSLTLPPIGSSFSLSPLSSASLSAIQTQTLFPSLTASQAPMRSPR